MHGAPHEILSSVWLHAGVLWTISPRMVGYLFLYSIVGTWLTTSAFGKRLMQLEFRVLQLAGDLRFSLLRTRENSGALCTAWSPGSCMLELHTPCQAPSGRASTAASVKGL